LLGRYEQAAFSYLRFTTDKAGNTLATRTAPNGSGIYPTTSYQGDDCGNVVQINPPNFFKKSL
jgi:hypothetical protein